MTATPVRWYVAAPWLRNESDAWRLTRFVPNENGALDFHVVPARYALDRSRKSTDFHAWRGFLGHGNRAWRAAVRSDRPSGIITAFPQLPIPVGLRKRLAFSNIPIVAWTFNLGKLFPGARRQMSRTALKAINRFIVHSRGEIAAYSDWLNLPPERFQFVPFETATRTVEFSENTAEPFIVSLGSAQRDYKLLFGVLAELQYPAVIVAAPHAVTGLSIPPNVSVRSGLTAHQCFELMQRARINVIPVANRTTASGQVTLLDAMMFARPVIVTDCLASVDYVTHGKDAWLVRHGDHDDMKAAIQRTWEDAALRGGLGVEARKTALSMFSEEVIGGVLGRVLRDVSASR